MQATLILTVLFAAIFLYYTTGFTGFYVIGAIIGVILIIVYLFQNKLLYMPAIPDSPLSPSDNQRGYRNPKQQGLQYQNLTLQTDDKVKIKGWHLKTKQQSDRIIVYFHQNAGNIGNRIPFMRALIQMTNSQVILVAYRGYSDSQGSPSEKGLQKDSQAIIKYAIDYNSRKDKKMPLYILGRSLGGAVAAHVATRPYIKDAITGVILQNTFTSIGDMIDQVMPVFRYLKCLQTNHWKSIERVPEITAPILFIKSMRDQLIPPRQMDRLISNANSSLKVDVYQIPMGTHNFSWNLNEKEYFQRLLKYFRQTYQAKQN